MITELRKIKVTNNRRQKLDSVDTGKRDESGTTFSDI